MPVAVGFDHEDAIFLGRRPPEGLESSSPRRLAANTASPYKFAHARTALKYGLMAHGLGRGDLVLVPELICEVVLEPLEQLGIGVRYYPVGPDLSPEWSLMERLPDGEVKALLVVHYFGQPQPILECVEFCRRNSLLLIEDNAHGFGATVAGQALGTFGEIGMSSPRKSFPVRNGAYLYLAEDRSCDLSTLGMQPFPTSPGRDRLNGRVKKIFAVKAALALVRGFAEYRRRRGPRPPYGSQDAFRDPPLGGDYGMDESAERFLARQDLERIRKLRGLIYHLWRQWAVTRGLTPVFPALAPGAAPLIFPAYAESAAASCQWYQRGHRAGIDIHSWPTLPPAIVKGNGCAMRLWERLVCCPIHQEMDPGLLAKRLARL